MRLCHIPTNFNVEEFFKKPYIVEKLNKRTFLYHQMTLKDTRKEDLESFIAIFKKFLNDGILFNANQNDGYSNDLQWDFLNDFFPKNFIITHIECTNDNTYTLVNLNHKNNEGIVNNLFHYIKNNYTDLLIKELKK